MSGSRFGDVLVHHRAGAVYATIDRPEVYNAINNGVIEGLAGAIDVATRNEARVLVLRGTGQTFCAGADLGHVAHLLERDDGGLETFVANLGEVLVALERAPFATVAAVEGFALAGGCEILLACDIVLATQDARIGDRHLEYGLLPGAGGSVRLPRSLTRARARYLLMTGEVIDGSQAAAWGLVTRAVDREVFDAELESLVQRLASRSGDALATVKGLIVKSDEIDVTSALEGERRAFSQYFRESPDGPEGLAAFGEKRAPRFRRPTDSNEDSQ